MNGRVCDPERGRFRPPAEMGRVETVGNDMKLGRKAINKANRFSPVFQRKLKYFSRKDPGTTGGYDASTP